MYKSVNAILALGFLVGLSACGSAPVQEEIIFLEPAPIVEEPVYNKYGCNNRLDGRCRFEKLWEACRKNSTLTS